MTDTELIAALHTFWDNFPGMVRLIDRNHRVIAANPTANDKGFTEGVMCATVGDPAIHRECKHGVMFATGKAQTDNVLPDRIRGWMPVEGHPDLCVHFAVMIPDVNP